MDQFKPIFCGAAIFLLAACATTPDPNSVQEKSDAEATASYTEEEWNDELMFQMQAAAHAGAVDEHDASLRRLIEAAESDRDVGLVRQAVGVAWRMERWELLSEAAGLWHELEPQSSDARRLMILSDLKQGRVEEATEAMQHWLATEVENAEQLLRRDLVQVIVAAEEAVDASAILNEVIAGSAFASEGVAAVAARSQLHWHLDDPKPAYELALQAARMGGGREHLVWAAQLATALNEYLEALDLYRRARSVDSEDWTLALAEAEVLRNLDRLDDALEVLASLPKNPDVLYSLASYRFQSGDVSGAEAAWQELADWSPVEDADQHAFLVAWLAEFLQLPADAAEWYARVRSGANVDRAMIRRAVLVADQGRLDEARELLKLARDTERQDQRERAFLVEAELLREHRHAEEAVALLGLALRETPGNIRLLYARALHAVEMDDLELAEQDLRRIIRLDGNNAMALNALGYTLTDRTHRHNEAYRLIRRALELEPEEPAILDSMGWVYFRLGRPEDALPYLEKALQGEDNPEIAAHLGEVLWHLDRREQAREVLQEAWLRHPGDRHLDDALQRLEITL